jgi:serine/threonine protein kinase
MVATDASRHLRVKELFFELADLAASEREARLAALGDPALVEELRSLLATEEADTEATRDFLGLRERFPPPPHSLRGEHAYRIVRELGRGGMGVVYLAEREDGGQQVAVKVLRSGVASKEAKSRFRLERQILGHLDHPAIARLYDGGATERGESFLVMEYVAGERLDRYCAHRGLTVAERLRLMVAVCGAVEHAHQKQIVHRDLKPANILVGADGEPKLLDFGIARLLQPLDLGEAPLETPSGYQPQTPHFASPEQVRGHKVTFASDVYALGVVLYQLLTGLSPYRVPEHDALALASAILGQEPERPSEVLLRSGAEEGGAPRLDDLDAIVLKALRKEPAERYGSAAELAADLDRYLQGLPVLAVQGEKPRRGWAFAAVDTLLRRP